MKNFIKTGIFLATLTSFAANASTFDFSYTFDDSSKVTGYVSGDLDGSYLDNITDAHVFLNGIEFVGASLFSAAWNTTTQDWDSTVGAVISPNALLNNFVFADSSVPTDYNVTNYFYFVNDPTSLGHQVFANNLNIEAAALDNPANGSWSLVAREPVAPVPLPAAAWLMVSALMGLGGIARRRQH